MTIGKTTRLDPEELHSNPAFTQGVIALVARTLYAVSYERQSQWLFRELRVGSCNARLSRAAKGGLLD